MNQSQATAKLIESHAFWGLSAVPLPPTSRKLAGLAPLSWMEAPSYQGHMTSFLCAQSSGHKDDNEPSLVPPRLQGPGVSASLRSWGGPLRSVREVTLPVLSIMVSQSLVPAQHMVGLSKDLGDGQYIWLLTPTPNFVILRESENLQILVSSINLGSKSSITQD